MQRSHGRDKGNGPTELPLADYPLPHFRNPLKYNHSDIFLRKTINTKLTVWKIYRIFITIFAASLTKAFNIPV
jgi:hypothetical protein